MSALSGKFWLATSAVMLLFHSAAIGQYARQPLDSSSVSNQAPTSFFQKDAVRIALPPATLFAASAATWGSREKIREIRNRYILTFHHHYMIICSICRLSVYMLLTYREPRRHIIF